MYGEVSVERQTNQCTCDWLESSIRVITKWYNKSKHYITLYILVKEMTVYINYPHSMRTLKRDIYFGQILWSYRGATYGSAVKPRKHSQVANWPIYFFIFFQRRGILNSAHNFWETFLEKLYFFQIICYMIQHSEINGGSEPKMAVPFFLSA